MHRIKAVSSNKVLRVFGKELASPAVGYPMSNATPDLQGAIVLIISHSGGTSAPLAISNLLLQAVSRNIFVVSREWETQIGKQLRKMCSEDEDILSGRVFSTEIGVRRPTEPCSLSVVATHQLLAQLFEYISLVVLNDQRFRLLSRTAMVEKDLAIFERCNQDCIVSLEHIVERPGKSVHDKTDTEAELSAADLWAKHILENARACILTFLHIVGTVTAGYPLVTGAAAAVNE